MELCRRCHKVLPNGWYELFGDNCISCENDIAIDEVSTLRAENERLTAALRQIGQAVAADEDQIQNWIAGQVAAALEDESWQKTR